MSMKPSMVKFPPTVRRNGPFCKVYDTRTGRRGRRRFYSRYFFSRDVKYRAMVPSTAVRTFASKVPQLEKGSLDDHLAHTSTFHEACRAWWCRIRLGVARLGAGRKPQLDR